MLSVGFGLVRGCRGSRRLRRYERGWRWPRMHVRLEVRSRARRITLWRVGLAPAWELACEAPWGLGARIRPHRTGTRAAADIGEGEARIPSRAGCFME